MRTSNGKNEAEPLTSCGASWGGVRRKAGRRVLHLVRSCSGVPGSGFRIIEKVVRHRTRSRNNNSAHVAGAMTWQGW